LVTAEAVPLRLAVMVLAAKFPLASRCTTAEAVFAALNVGFPVRFAHGNDPTVTLPSVAILALPAHVERAVFSTLPRPTAVEFSACHDLSPRQYCAVVPAVIVGSLPDKAVVRFVTCD